MAIDTQALRGALGQFTTGVTIMTCSGPQGERHGLTVNSFNSLSLDPALVTWALRRASPLVQPFLQAGHFAVNVLAASQMEVSRRFASPVPDRFAAGQWVPGPHALPWLAGATARLACRTHQHLEAGDHLLFVGEVLAVEVESHSPLLYHGGRYCLLGEPL
ncbi:flavin reductase family protein [Ideonella livida]|uniref:Flavin reductase family protein n=1 Tax=Ideonella livida TaxID=2707176 RepID=A0A7C9TJG2_9BURK|nr:flavin reductase family protein [Ideonella livida]NDY90605.1 flavin reductase family protein [Ideonella livida]